MKRSWFVVVFAVLLLMHPRQGQAEPLQIYIDADYSISHEAADAIEMGIRSALSQVNDRLGGLEVEVVARDHHGNSKRSYRTMQQFLSNDRALLMFGGLHSPPYLTHKDYINSNELLMLLPWSAAGPITRSSEGTENWMFRLSIDDSKAGRFLVQSAVEDSGCQRLTLILVNTGWGRANQTSMTKAMEDLGASAPTVIFFDQSIGKASAATIAKQVARSQSDCAIMLAETLEAAHIVRALHETVPGLKLFSHWAILGRQFAELVPHDIRTDLRLRVLQTCGLKRELQNPEILQQALQRIPGKGSAISRLSDFAAPPGFVHGYDLTLVLIAAAEQASKSPMWHNGIADKRRALRQALENLQSPVPGILDTYSSPFAPYSHSNPDAHEALGAEHLCLSEYLADGGLAHASDR